MLRAVGGVRNYVLAQSAVPWGIANSGTIATAGTVALGTALNTTYTGGIWLYYPAAAFAASAAGFYWTVMSSTTAGTVFTTQTSGVQVTGSNAAYTGDTTIRTAVTINLPGNSVGANGSFKTLISGSINNSAGAKTLTTKLGASTLGAVAATTNTAIGMNSLTSNRNSLALNKTSNNTALTGTTGMSQTWTTIDTSTDQSITLNLTLAVATDVLVMEGYLIEVLPG